MNKNYKHYLYWNNDTHHHSFYPIEAVYKYNIEDYCINNKYSFGIISRDFVSTNEFFPEYMYVYNIFILERYDGISLDRHKNQEKYEYYI